MSNKTIDYKKLSVLVEQMIKELESGHLECQKECPDEVKICDHVVENLGSLFDQAYALILPNNFCSMQYNNGVSIPDVVVENNLIESIPENKDIRCISDK